MAEFRKKQIVIEAVQMTKEMRNNLGPFPDWAMGALTAKRTEKIHNSERVYIETLEGIMEVKDEDWIIRGVKGEIYPCKPDIFSASYDTVDDLTRATATLREQVAILCHSQWSGWMDYLFSKGTFAADGSWTMPSEFVQRWQRQSDAPYMDLSEGEQESDRKQADKFIRLFAQQGNTALPDLS